MTPNRFSRIWPRFKPWFHTARMVWIDVARYPMAASALVWSLAMVASTLHMLSILVWYMPTQGWQSRLYIQLDLELLICKLDQSLITFRLYNLYQLFAFSLLFAFDRTNELGFYQLDRCFLNRIQGAIARCVVCHLLALWLSPLSSTSSSSSLWSAAGWFFGLASPLACLELNSVMLACSSKLAAPLILSVLGHSQGANLHNSATLQATR